MLKRRDESPVQTRYVNRGNGFQPVSAFRDIVSGLAHWRIWVAMAGHEFMSTYRRTALGMFWVVMSFAGFVFVKLTIFSSLLTIGTPGYYDAYLVLGFFVWFYLSQSTSAASDTFVSNQSWIKSEPLPLSVYVYKSVLREFYSFALTATVAVAGVIYTRFEPNLELIGFSLLAIAFTVISAAALKLLLGTVAARFRDVSHLVRAVMLPMMFLTPIFWMPSQMPGLMKYLWWNPFFHYLEIFRAPLMDGVVPVASWLFVLCVFGVLCLAGFLLFARFRQRIVFWF